MIDRSIAVKDKLCWCLPSVYGERYALAACEGGSVLLDVEGGTFFQLNSVAAAICRGLARDEPVADIAHALAGTYHIPLDQAARDIASVLDQFGQTPALTGHNPIRFEADAGGYLLRWHGQDVCQLNAQGTSLIRRPGAAIAESPLPLMWTAPHVLVLHGRLVLHASAVRHGDGALAFCGPSGVGKTTLAHLFGKREQSVLAEDLLLIAFDGTTPEVILGGEAGVRGWAERHIAQFAAGGPVSTDDLLRASDGVRVPLRELWFLGRSDAPDSVIRHKPLLGVEALVLLLQNSFAELGQRAVWTELLEANRRVANATPAQRAWCPKGLEVLREAVAAYR